jgi:hypothetical protein
MIVERFQRKIYRVARSIVRDDMKPTRSRRTRSFRRTRI